MDKKSQQLGMNFSTASGRLERMILFRFVNQTGQANCYRCGKVILCYGDLSVEHKIAWQNVDPALFWDLENIAFSHKRCNTLAHRSVRPSDEHIRKMQKGAKNFVKAAPVGQAWCSGHRKYHPVKEFAKDKHQVSCYRAHCKKYRATKPW